MAQRVLELRGLEAATEEMRLAELWGQEVAPIYRRFLGARVIGVQEPGRL